MSFVSRASLMAALLTLSACAAPHLENPKRPGADAQADMAACQSDAERAAKLDQLARPMEFQNDCPNCVTRMQGREMQATLSAFAKQKQCMAARGWRQAS